MKHKYREIKLVKRIFEDKFSEAFNLDLVEGSLFVSEYFGLSVWLSREGLFVRMSAIRREESLSSKHSNYVGEFNSFKSALLLEQKNHSWTIYGHVRII